VTGLSLGVVVGSRLVGLLLGAEVGLVVRGVPVGFAVGTIVNGCAVPGLMDTGASVLGLFVVGF